MTRLHVVGLKSHSQARFKNKLFMTKTMIKLPAMARPQTLSKEVFLDSFRVSRCFSPTKTKSFFVFMTWRHVLSITGIFLCITQNYDAPWLFSYSPIKTKSFVFMTWRHILSITARHFLPGVQSEPTKHHHASLNTLSVSEKRSTHKFDNL